MPRGPRGGPRNGTPGTAYPNRTDLAQQPSLPARVATDQTYGKAQQQLQAQRTVPMAPPPTLIGPTGPGPAAAPPGPPAPAGPPAGPGPALPPAPLPPQMAPGGAGPLERATERPDEPVTAGAPLGPGPGPELPTPTVNLAGILGRAAQTTGSSVLAALAQRAGLMNQ